MEPLRTSHHITTLHSYRTHFSDMYTVDGHRPAIASVPVVSRPGGSRSGRCDPSFRLTDEQTPRWKLNGAIYTEGYCKILPAYLTILWPLDVYPLHPFTLHTILLTIHPIPALVRGWCFC